jgi:hypothetical protein
VRDFDSRWVTAQVITVPLEDFHFGPMFFQTHFKPDVANVGVSGHGSEKVGLSVATDQHRRVGLLHRLRLVHRFL